MSLPMAAPKVNRQTEDGYDGTCPLPAVISVTAGVVEPRYQLRESWPPIEAGQTVCIRSGVTPVGWDGAGQTISNVTKAEACKAGEIVEDDGEDTPRSSRSSNLKVI
jgi:electron transfer flavoprotein beta subunit